MAEMVEAKAEKKRARKHLDHIRISKAKNGGHVIEHHHDSMEHPPETHVFGPDEGDKLLAHVAKHMGIPGAAEEEGESDASLS